MPTERRLLFLAQTLPYPPHGGVENRTFNTFRQLCRAFRVTMLCFFRRRGAAGGRVEESVAALNRMGPTRAFPIPEEWSRLRLLWDHLRSLGGGKAYTWYVYQTAAYRRALEEVIAGERFDLVHVDSLDLAAYLPRVLRLGVPVACTHHNVESLLLSRRATLHRGSPLGWYLSHQARLTERLERRWCGAMDLNVAVSAEDAATLRRLVPEIRTLVAPNGVDTAEFAPRPGAGDAIVFLGGANWFPNTDAMEYFGAAILPLVRRLGVNLPVRWVGKASPERVASFRERFGIELTGYVEDVRPYLADAVCCIAPLRIGGGTRLKILDAWAMGKAMVSTTVGCEGLGAVHGRDIMIGDTPETFAGAIAEVATDPGLRGRLERAARLRAERDFDWNRVGDALAAAYHSLCDAR